MNGFVFHIAAYCLLLLRVLKEHKGVLGVPISQSHLMTAYLLTSNTVAVFLQAVVISPNSEFSSKYH